MDTSAMEPARANGEGRTRQRGSGLRKRATAGAAMIAAIAALGLLAACASSPSSSSSSPAAGGATTPASTASASPAAATGTASLKTETTSLGSVLTNGQGMTVYWFAADHGTSSACSGACAAAWPPVIGMPQAASGVTLSGTLGTITRSLPEQQREQEQQLVLSPGNTDLQMVAGVSLFGVVAGGIVRYAAFASGELTAAGVAGTADSCGGADRATR